MKTFFVNASAGAVASLLYSALLTSAPGIDWYRAAFVGVFCGFWALAWSRKKPASPPGKRD